MTADDDTELNTYDTSEADSERIEPALLYPIIAVVLATFCVFSITAFILTSNKKCCKSKKQDVESVLLKQQLVAEQKKLSKAHFTLPLGDHPSFTSIMQQEENDIAEEVKESYKSISLDISKPIICCPNHKMSYVYEPKDFFGERNIFTRDQICPSECSFRVGEQSFDDKQEHNAFIEQQGVRQRFYIAPSEIENAEDVKALYFENWLRQTEENEIGELKSESDYRFEKLELSYDDVESILTSISRMDSNRLQRLKDTKFYQNLMNNIDIPNEESVENDTSIESIDLREIDHVVTERTGNKNNQCNFTHDEIMSAFVENKSEHLIFEELDNRVKILSNNEKHNTCHSEKVIEKDEKLNKSVIPVSESLFKVVQKLPSTEKSLIEKKPLLRRYASSEMVDNSSEVTSHSDTSTTLRPDSLHLKHKNSDLSLETSDVSSTQYSVSNSSISSKKYVSKNSFTRSSYTTSWHEICDENQQHQRRRTVLHKDENLNIISRSKESRKLQNTNRSTSKYLSEFSDTDKSRTLKKKSQNLSRSSSVTELRKQNKIKHLKTSQHIKLKNRSLDTSLSFKRRTKAKSRLENTSTASSSDFNTTLK